MSSESDFGSSLHEAGRRNSYPLLDSDSDTASLSSDEEVAELEEHALLSPSSAVLHAMANLPLSSDFTIPRRNEFDPMQSMPVYSNLRHEVYHTLADPHELGEDVILTPLGKSFERYNDLDEYLRTFAIHQGFNFVKKHPGYWRNPKVLNRIEYLCHMHNPPSVTTGSSHRLRRGVGSCCPFKLLLRQKSRNGPWTFEAFGTHNHSPTHSCDVLAVAERLPPEIKTEIIVQHKQGVHPREILRLVRFKFPVRLIAESTLRRFIYTYNAKALEGKSPVLKLYQHFLDKGYIVHMQPDKSRRIQHIFFTSPKLKNMTKQYGKCLILDCTYKTNRFRKPLLHVIGLSPFNTNFQVCFAFLGDESMGAYIWALEKIKALYDDGTGPKVLVTDDSRALKGAIDAVFPNSKHILCRWHISKNCRKKCEELRYDPDTRDRLIRQWKLCMDSQSEIELKSKMKELQAIIPSDRRLIQYLRNNWLNRKEKFVSAWLNKFEHYGIHTTSRVEGSHSVIKSYIRSRHKDLTYIFDRIDEYCTSEYNELENMVHTDSYSSYPPGRVDLFVPLRFKISGHCFKMLRDEYHDFAREKNNLTESSEESVTQNASDSDNPPFCACLTRVVYGIPCRHLMAYHADKDIPFKIQDISEQWRLPHVRGVLDEPFPTPNPLTKEALCTIMSEITNMISSYDLTTFSQLVQVYRTFCSNPEFAAKIARTLAEDSQPTSHESQTTTVWRYGTLNNTVIERPAATSRQAALDNLESFMPGSVVVFIPERYIPHYFKDDRGQIFRRREDFHGIYLPTHTRVCSLCGNSGHSNYQCRLNVH